MDTGIENGERFEVAADGRQIIDDINRCQYEGEFVELFLFGDRSDV